jgi:hypothetical protein
MWKADTLLPPEIVPITQMSGHFARGIITYRQTTRYWITMSVCHVRITDLLLLIMRMLLLNFGQL